MRFDWGRRLSIHGIRQFVRRKMLKKSAIRLYHIYWYHLVQGLACTDNHEWLLIATTLALKFVVSGSQLLHCKPYTDTTGASCLGATKDSDYETVMSEGQHLEQQELQRTASCLFNHKTWWHVIIKPSWYTSWCNIAIFRYNIRSFTIFNLRSCYKIISSYKVTYCTW